MGAIRTLRLLAASAALAGTGSVAAWADPPAAPAPAAHIAYPAPAEYSKIVFDRADGTKITGQLSQVDVIDGVTYAWVLAHYVEKTGFGARSDKTVVQNQVWRVEGPVFKSMKPADSAKLVAGAIVVFDGLNSTDKSCKPTCRIKADSVSFK
ncbi:MAG TPA: hypothetical protein VG942_16445 [Hyphomonadaceae bacterium]|nr:hypothetical protein [Hyphomonadaceae bacterium]